MKLDFPTVKAPQFRDGIGIRDKDFDKWVIAGGAVWGIPVLGRTTAAMRNEGDYAMSDLENAYKEAVDKVGGAQEAYVKLVNGFKGHIKNDMASIAASADRVQREGEKMRRAYTDAVSTLTSPDMEQAIANAERLAKALEAISALQSHSITFAVLDKKSGG